MWLIFYVIKSDKSGSNLDYQKQAYQVAPISAITHVAEVKRIEKYKDTDKYILYFKGDAKPIKKVALSGQTKGNAPQAPRYTSYTKLLEANTLDELWG